MDDRDFADLAEEVRILAAITTKHAVLELERRLHAAGASVSALQFGVLRALDDAIITLSELSRLFALEPATLVPVIDALERKGYVNRTRDPFDRRRNPIQITDAGRAIARIVPRPDSRDPIAQALKAFGAARSAELYEMLHELARHVTGDPALVNRLTSGVRARRDPE